MMSLMRSLAFHLREIEQESLVQQWLFDSAMPVIPSTEEENIQRGEMAMRFVIEHRTDFPHAMYRADLGWVDFIWGTPGVIKPSGKTKGAKGVSHILEARQRKDGHSPLSANALALRLVQVIAKGKVIRNFNDANGDTSNKTIEWQGLEAILVKEPSLNEWLLTGWEVTSSR